jgi:hypothetical protein
MKLLNCSIEIQTLRCCACPDIPDPRSCWQLRPLLNLPLRFLCKLFPADGARVLVFECLDPSIRLIFISAVISREPPRPVAVAPHPLLTLTTADTDIALLLYAAFPQPPQLQNNRACPKMIKNLVGLSFLTVAALPNLNLACTWLQWSHSVCQPLPPLRVRI